MVIFHRIQKIAVVSCLAAVTCGLNALGFSPPSTFATLKRVSSPTPTCFPTCTLLRPTFQLKDVGVKEQEQTFLGQEKNFTVRFPSYFELERLERGEFVASSSFSVESPNGEQHDFRVLLYPRGGGHTSSSTTTGKKLGNKDEEGGFGMSFKAVPLFGGRKDDKVGVYLQYLAKDEESTVDVTYSLRLKGQQSSGSKFDVEWSSGMRFVSKSKGNLREGLANDFGAHVMQSELLPVFLGVADNDGENEGKLEIEVRTKVHPRPLESIKGERGDSVSSSSTGTSIFPLKDIRGVNDNNGMHNGENVRVGKIVVPVLRRLSQRPRMFEIGAYPGVEYRIMRIFDPSGEEIFASVPGAKYDLRPIYPLVPQLERQWPVRVCESEIPKLYTAGMYNAISAIGSFATAAAGLTIAFVLSQLISLFFIPSKSMDPTLEVGDVLLVEKVTPRLDRGVENVGDVVLFSPPKALQDIVAKSGGKVADRDLFVKRIAAGPGDTVSVNSKGSVMVNEKPVPGNRDLCEEEPLRLIEKYIKPVNGEKVDEDSVFVMGDCSSVSVDSRVWGPLKKENIVGRPILRIWPFERFGSIQPLPTDESVSDKIE